VKPRVIGYEVVVARTLVAHESIHSTVRRIHVTDVPLHVHGGTIIGKEDAVEVCDASEAIPLPTRVGDVTSDLRMELAITVRTSKN